MAKRRVRWWRMPPEVRQEVIRLAAQGLSYRQIRARVDISAGSVQNVLRPLGGVIRKDMLADTGWRLSLAERVEIRLGLERGQAGGQPLERTAIGYGVSNHLDVARQIGNVLPRSGHDHDRADRGSQ